MIRKPAAADRLLATISALLASALIIGAAAGPIPLA